MASISLREYHSNLQDLLRQDETDRVIAHCRHILQTFPRNGQTYRLLGKALISDGQWERAGDVWRRILAIYPDDPEAHYELAQVSERLEQPDAAIWHLERSLEIEPNNTGVMETLRAMYREHRDTDLKKIPLTSGAVARQYRRSGLYDNAIVTIRQAISAQPKRADLRLLLAQTYWDRESYVESAESALEVLDALPYCFEANEILALLWLGEDRPADATAYLAVMEQIDPYESLALVQEGGVPDDTFMLEELDFARFAQQEMIASGSDLFGDLEADEIELSEDVDAEQEEGLDNFFVSDMSESDVSDSAVGEEVGVAEMDDESPLANEADDDDPMAWMDADDDDVIVEDVSDAFADAGEGDPMAWMDEGYDIDEGDVDDDDPMAWIDDDEAVDADEAVVADDSPSTDEDDDPLAWLESSGGERVDEGEVGAELFSATDALARDNEDTFESSQPADPLAWLENDYIDEDDAAEDDLSGWESGDEIVDTGSDFAGTIQLEDESDADFGGDDELDWMSSDNNVLDEMLDMEDLASDDDDLSALFDEASPTPEAASQWMDDEEAGEASDNESDLDEADEALDWMTSLDDEGDEDFDVLAAASGDDDELEWMENIDVGGDAPVALGGAWLDNLAEDGEDADFEDDDGAWLDDAVGSGALDTSSLGWLEDEGDESLEDADEPDGSGDVAAGDFDAVDDASSLEELVDDDLDLEDDAEAIADGETPDWLAEAKLSDTTGSLDAAFGEDDSEMEWLSEPSDNIESQEGEPQMTDDLFDDEDANEPDWLSSMGEAEDGGDDLDDLFADADDEPDWMTDAVVSDAASTDDSGDDEFDALFGDEGEAVAADEPDWLSDLGDADGEGEPEEEDEFGAMFADASLDDDGDDELDALFGDEEEAVASDEPDWLSDLGDEGDEGEPEEEGEFGAMFADASLEDDGDDELDALFGDEEEAVASDEPDWLSDLGDEGVEGEPEEEGEFGAMFADASLDDDGDDEFDALFGDEEEAVASDEPDWLSDLGDEGVEGEPEEEGEFGAMFADASLEDDGDDEFDALFGDEEEAVASDEPDWLSDLGDEGDEGEPEEEGEFGAMFADASVEDDGDDEFDALFGDEEEAVAADEPDWLSDLGDEGDEGEPEEEGEFGAMFADASVEDDGDDEFDALFGEEESEAVAADEPGWLSDLGDEGVEGEPEEEGEFGAMFADASVEDDGDDEFDALFGEEESEAVAADEPDWLSDLGDADSEVESETSEAYMSDDRLDDLFGDDEPEDVEDEQPDWMAGLEDADASDGDEMDWDVEEDGEPLVAQAEDNDPDWLANLGAASTADDDANQPEWLSSADAYESSTDDDGSDDMFGEEDEAFAVEPSSSPVDDLFADVETESSPMDDLFGDEDTFEDDGLDDVDTVVVGEQEDDDGPDWLTFDPEDELLSEDDEEEMDVAPVDAAPEWLNAMVPGLDMDFSAEADEPVETEFVESEESYRNQAQAEPTSGNPTRAFKWLVDIVDQEADSPVASSTRRPRFVFTRPPLWQRRGDAGDSSSDVRADDLAGDADPSEDEPAWLDNAFEEFDDDDFEY